MEQVEQPLIIALIRWKSFEKATKEAKNKENERSISKDDDGKREIKNWLNDQFFISLL